MKVPLIVDVAGALYLTGGLLLLMEALGVSGAVPHFVGIALHGTAFMAGFAFFYHERVIPDIRRKAKLDGAISFVQKILERDFAEMSEGNRDNNPTTWYGDMTADEIRKRAKDAGITPYEYVLARRCSEILG